MRFFKGEQPPYRGVVYRPNGRTLITATQTGLVMFWDLDAGCQLTRLRCKTNPLARTNRLDAIALSPDGRLLAAAGYTLTVWDLETGEVAAGFDSAHVPAFRDVSFVMNGTRLVASIDNMGAPVFREHGLAMWNTADGSALPMLPTNGYTGSLTTSPDGESVIVEVNAQSVRWHLPTGVQHPSRLGGSHSAASKAANITAQGSYRTVAIRDANGERLLAQWEGHEKGVFALAFSSDGNLLATGSGDEVVKVWDVSGVANVLADPNAPPLTIVPERGAYEWGIGPVRAIAFSPDGLTAAAVGDRVKFVVWDVG